MQASQCILSAYYQFVSMTKVKFLKHNTIKLFRLIDLPFLVQEMKENIPDSINLKLPNLALTKIRYLLLKE